MSFAETRLELGIDYGTVGGFRFSTSVLVDGSGAEQRNANWAQPLGRWQIGDRSLTQSELDYFLDFHAARKGAAEGFRFKDWADYQATQAPIGIGDGSKTQFQLIKSYTHLAYTAIRPIIKPVGGTVKIYLGGTQVSGWTADTTTGVITFANPPASGVVIVADFEFDVPVRFEQDSIQFRFEAYEVSIYPSAIFYLQDLHLIEIRLTTDSPIPFTPVPPQIAQTLNLGYDYGTVGGPAYNTAIATTGGGHERRTSNWAAPRGRWQVGDRTLKREELDYLIAFHRNTRGAAANFTYKDWQQNRNATVRFEEDSLDFRFDAYDPDTQEAIFYLAGLPVVEIVEFLPKYNCENGVCVPDINGIYDSYAECVAALVPTNSIFFLESDFNTEDWLLATVGNNTGGNTTVTQEVSGGNPGFYRKIRNEAGGVFPTVIGGLHKKKGVIFNPQVQGSITAINFSFDRKVITNDIVGGQPNISLLVIQNNNAYQGPTNQNAIPEWNNKTYMNLSATDFNYFSSASGGTYTFIPGNHPDFSNTGSSIEFGFISIDTFDFKTFVEIGIDNFSVSVTSLVCP